MLRFANCLLLLVLLMYCIDAGKVSTHIKLRKMHINARNKRFGINCYTYTNCVYKRGPPVCYQWCYKHVIVYGCVVQQGPYCCQYRERFGHCPASFFCPFQYNSHLNTLHLKCEHDFQCPAPTKCCFDICYQHNICKYPDLFSMTPATTYSENTIATTTTVTNKATTEEVTTEEATTKETTTEEITTNETTIEEITTEEATTEEVTTVEATTEEVTTVEATTEEISTENSVEETSDEATEAIDGIATEDESEETTTEELIQTTTILVTTEDENVEEIKFGPSEVIDIEKDVFIPTEPAEGSFDEDDLIEVEDKTKITAKETTMITSVQDKDTVEIEDTKNTPLPITSEEENGSGEDLDYLRERSDEDEGEDDMDYKQK